MEYDKGYIRLNRRFFSEIMWTEARTFSSCEAWLDLIQSARFDATPRKVSIGGREVVVCRGQFAASIRFLAKRWQWGERKVRSFLVYLKKREMITSESSQGVNLITVLNYDEYSGNAGWDTSRDTCKDTTKDTSITHSIKDLQELKTQPETQLRTQPKTQPPKTAEKGRNLGHSKDTKLNKEEESINISKEIKENTPYGVLKKKEKEEADVTLKTSENTPSPGSAPPPSPRIDYSAIMRDFNTRFAGVLPAVMVMTEKRKAAVRARIGEHGMDSIAKVFDSIAVSGFLKGHNNHNWKADFDWVFRPTNYVKILEGNYTSTNYGREKHQRFGATPPDDFAGKGSTKL